MTQKEKVYVSLTTISSRIKRLGKTIDSLLKQTIKPNEIRVYLSKEAYLLDEGIKEEQIPPKLKQYHKESKIKLIYTENTGPYRKLLPILKEKWDEKCIIITADDDVTYPTDWIEKLLESSKEFPNSIIAYRCRNIKIKGKKIAPYDSWEIISLKEYLKDENSINSKRVFPTGRNGVLYKPSFFKKIIFDRIFLKLCPNNDDIWFKIISLISGTNNQVIFSDEGRFGFADNKADKTRHLNEINLNKKNKMNNDAQLKKVINYLKKNYHMDIYNLLGPEKKSKINVPKYARNLPGTFWGITTFFNPAGYAKKYENYKLFRENSKRQGLNLLTVELAFGDKPFELKKEDAEILIQIRGNENNIMWQKEALLNIGLKNLPKNCDKIAWLDCDIIFENNNWIKETSKLLEKYKIVQPYSLSISMPKNKKIHEIIPKNLKFGILNNEKRNSLAYTMKNIGNKTGHPGFAWTARREIFDKISFYDKLILGSGDVLISNSFYSGIINFSNEYHSTQLIAEMSKYQKKLFSLVAKSVSYNNGTLYHLWHGDFKKRKYIERSLILKNNKFDPNKDVTKNQAGLLIWKTNKKTLKKAVKSYFLIRNEDGKNRIPCFSKFYHLKYISNRENYKTLFNLKKDIILGTIGKKIKTISPNLHTILTKNKPSWARPIKN